MVKPLDISGLRFGRLTALESKGAIRASTGTTKTHWRCICDCGNEVSVALGNLRSGSIKSCGCFRKEVLDKTSHGFEGTREYSSWIAMMNRCNNKNIAAYENYGARGITVCDRWKRIENFILDMGTRPEGKTLERINVNGNYEPNNCKWATTIEQANNKRTSRFIEFRGKTATLSQWARELDIPVETLFARLKKHPPEIAFTK